MFIKPWDALPFELRTFLHDAPCGVTGGCTRSMGETRDPGCRFAMRESHSGAREIACAMRTHAPPPGPTLDLHSLEVLVVPSRGNSNRFLSKT